MILESENRPQSFLNPTKQSNAKIVFDKIPNFEFLTQKFVLPAVSASPTYFENPYAMISRPGDKIQFQKPWTLEIILDEGYISYFEIYSWFKSYLNISGDGSERDFSKIVSDARIVLLDNQTKEIGSIVFNDVFPIGLSSIMYSINDSSYEYVKFNVDFEYSIFDIELNS